MILRGLFFLILPVSVYAQILNVEKIRLEYPEDKVVFGNIGTNLSYHNRSANLQTDRKSVV